jgi:hypothetical protein
MPVRIAAGGFRKARCSSPAALENLFVAPQWFLGKYV